METKEEVRQRIQNLIDDTDLMIQEAQNYLISQGKIVDLTEWLTITKYCQRFNIKNTATVVNWIKRGIIPEENVRVVEELNNLRLIKAVPYHMKAEKVS